MIFEMIIQLRGLLKHHISNMFNQQNRSHCPGYAMWRYWPYYVIMLLTIVQYDVATTLNKLYDSSFASRYMDFFKNMLNCPLNRHSMHLSFHQILPLLVYLHVHIDSNLNFAVYLCIVRFV
jgi:hypothetical protein